MNSILRSALLVASATTMTSSLAAERRPGDHPAIESVLARYETALNQSDTSSVLPLYADDGVFMPQHSQPSVGSEAIRAAYDAVFKAITLEVSFTVDEVVQVAPTWAFARTRSSGFVTVHANGMRMPEANQELFLLQKTPSGDWKIARYIFSTTNPTRP